MGRPKKFSREEVLKKAMPLFWSKGFADTGLQELEKATGVNKSGLYSEFKDKDELFIESLRYYYANRKGRELLDREPFGFQNIEDYLRLVANRAGSDILGCFGVNCMRELNQLPGEAREMIEASRARLQAAFLKNAKAEKTSVAPEVMAEMLLTFFTGLCIEQNMENAPTIFLARIDGLMHALRRM